MTHFYTINLYVTKIFAQCSDIILFNKLNWGLPIAVLILVENLLNVNIM